MINKNMLFGLLILPYGGGGNCLFGVEDKTTPLFRGNVAIVEVASADTNPTEIPNTGIFYSGALGTTARCFDIICAGKCETGASDRVKLDVQPASEIPDFFTKNSEGKIVFAAPQIVGTVKAAKGHNSWVQIDLKTINGDLTSDVAKHVCLGIKKNDEDDFFDIIHAGHLTSRYVDVTQESYIELIPLISKTSTTEDTGYVAVTPGTEIAFTDITVPTTGEFNFGSVYRVNVSIHDSQWLTDQPCNLSSIASGSWYNIGHMGIGAVTDSDGTVHENQFVAVRQDSEISAYSPDGIHWRKTIGSIGSDVNRETGAAYGNGIWCTISCTSANVGVQRSLDGIKTWSGTLAKICAHNLYFGNDIFMTIDNSGIVYTSPDAEIWTQIGSTGIAENHNILIYGDDKWICGRSNGYIYWSKDGAGTWTRLDDGSLNGISTSRWYGGCYVNGYFYVIHNNGLIARSPTGKTWKQVFNIGTSGYQNISYRDNKLWAFNSNGQKYVVGLFNPDGTIESLE